MNRGRPMLLARFAVLVAVLLTFLDASPAAPPGPLPARVTFPSNEGTRPVPANFLGLSLETSELCQFLRLRQKNPANLTLLRNLGLGVLRIGGTSEDSTRWEPNGRASCYFDQSVFNKSLIRRFATFSNAFHWRVIWGLNLGANDPPAAMAEAAYVESELGPNLLGFEIGNEPDLYSQIPLRHVGYSVSDFETEWSSYSRLLRANVPGVQLVGPSTAYLDWFRSFVLSRTSLGLSIATHHFYPTQIGSRGNRAPTITNLLSKAVMANTATLLSKTVAIAAERGLPVRFDESNSVASGGLEGVSDSFAAALWAADYLLTALDRGVVGVDVHEGEGENPYSPILFSTASAQSMYYAMLFFQLATAGSLRTVPVDLSSTANVAAHATETKSGQLRLAILNKGLQGKATVQITLPQSYSSARTLKLSAPSAGATSNITLGGSRVLRDGTWSARTSTTQSIRGRDFTVTVGPASAQLITFS